MAIRQLLVNTVVYDVVEDRSEDDGRFGRIRFRVKGDVESQILGELQKQMGWHPCGYGGPNGISAFSGWTHWHCACKC